MPNPVWTRDELILGLECYLQNGPKAIHAKSNCITDLSNCLRNLPVHPVAARSKSFRNPEGVALTLSGFIALDTSNENKGIRHNSCALIDVWEIYKDKRDYIFDVAQSIRSVSSTMQRIEILRDEEAKKYPEGLILYSLHRFIESQLKHPMSDRKKCEMCGIEPKEVYGDYEILSPHHDIPIYKYSGIMEAGYQDSILLCPNCHVVVHRMTPKTYIRTAI